MILRDTIQENVCFHSKSLSNLLNRLQYVEFNVLVLNWVPYIDISGLRIGNIITPSVMIRSTDRV